MTWYDELTNRERTGIVLALYPFSDSQGLEIQRAPDDGFGDPDVGSAVTVGFTAPGVAKFMDLLPLDGANRHYRSRHVEDTATPSGWTSWVGATPVIIPDPLPPVPKLAGNEIFNLRITAEPQDDGKYRYFLEFEAGEFTESVNIGVSYVFTNPVQPPPTTTVTYDYDVDVTAGGVFAEYIGDPVPEEVPQGMTLGPVFTVGPYDKPGGSAGAGDRGNVLGWTPLDTDVTGSGTAFVVGAGTPVKADASLVGTSIQMQSVGGRPAIGVQHDVKVWGATGDGVADDTAEIQAAIDAAEADGGGMVWFPSGTYLISDHLDVPRSVSLYGIGPIATGLKAAAEKSVKVTGAGDWLTTIAGMMFDTVGVVYGEGVGDYANGAVLERVEIFGCVNGVKYTNNSWDVEIRASRLHDNTNGVYYDYAGAGAGAGSATRITNCNIFDNTVGVYVNGITVDGYSIWITDCDIENSSSAHIKTVAAGDGTIHFDGHMESAKVGTYYFDLDGGNVFVGRLWGVGAGANVTAVFNMTGAARVWLSNYRLQWDASKLVRFAGEGYLMPDSDSGLCAAKFFGLGGTAMAVAGSNAAGRILNGGMAHAGVGGKVFAGRSNENFQLPAANASRTCSTIQGWEGSTRIIEFYLDVTVAATNTQIFRVDLNPGGAGTVRVDYQWAAPIICGGFVRIAFTPLGQFNVMATFTDNVGNLAFSHYGGGVDGHAIGVAKFVDISSLDPIGNPATMFVRSYQEYVL